MLKRLKNMLVPPPPPPPEPEPDPAAIAAYTRHTIWTHLATLDEAERLSIAREIMAGALPPEERFQIPLLEKRTTPPLNTWRMQNERMDFRIPEGAKVLDVGSGGWPFTRATHLADMFPEDTSHRREALARDERPFDVVDIHKLPYEDNAFDFVFCSHVLEHLDDPGQAIRELNRVAPRGYVEVPTRLSDVMFNFTGMKDHHRWHGLNLNGTLALTEWTDAERRDLGDNHFWQMAQSGYHNPFQSHLEKAWGYFFIGIQWEGKLPFVVISNSGEILDRS
jgi:SAM-dependent methyltransferase